ncbi:MAG: hypothetical protein ACXVI1_09495, partial [Halobacteriota archaeon]
NRIVTRFTGETCRAEAAARGNAPQHFLSSFYSKARYFSRQNKRIELTRLIYTLQQAQTMGKFDWREERDRGALNKTTRKKLPK